MRMSDEAARKGMTLKAYSGFRDYRHQQRIYSESVAHNGIKQRGAARPGTSEHMLGTTSDVTSTERYVTNSAFANTPDGRWLAQNCTKYGFVRTVTGEPWHVRYFGSPSRAKAEDARRSSGQYRGPAFDVSSASGTDNAAPKTGVRGFFSKVLHPFAKN